MRILVVEDDPRLAYAVAAHLRKEKHVVDIVHDGLTGYDYSLSAGYELLLIDVALPGLDGVHMCAKLREAATMTPVLMVTARDRIGDKVRALDAGADDYLTKPFDLLELSARVRALGRRGKAERMPVLRFGALELESGSSEIRVDGRRVDCTRTEFTILEVLLRNPRQVFSREMLLERARCIDSAAADGSIKTHVANLRRKMRSAACPHEVIQTEHGFGYRLADPP